jgi:hypothetical protein
MGGKGDQKCVQNIWPKNIRGIVRLVDIGKITWNQLC